MKVLHGRSMYVRLHERVHKVMGAPHARAAVTRVKDFGERPLVHSSSGQMGMKVKSLVKDMGV